MGLVRLTALSVGLLAVELYESWRFPSKTRLRTLPPMKPESAVLGDVRARRDWCEAFRLAAGSPSGRLLEGRKGKVLSEFLGLGAKSGRKSMSCTVEGCSPCSIGLNWSGTGEEGLEWPRRWKRRWPSIFSVFGINSKGVSAKRREGGRKDVSDVDGWLKWADKECGQAASPVHRMAAPCVGGWDQRSGNQCLLLDLTGWRFEIKDQDEGRVNGRHNAAHRYSARGDC